jgi:hypothetical protein
MGNVGRCARVCSIAFAAFLFNHLSRSIIALDTSHSKVTQLKLTSVMSAAKLVLCFRLFGLCDMIATEGC